MNGTKAREIHKLALMTYKTVWFTLKRMTFKNYYRKLKKEYVEGSYGKN